MERKPSSKISPEDRQPVSKPSDRLTLVRELANAVSTQAQVVNRTWIALMTVALFGILPRSAPHDGDVSLPFNLGQVDPIWFHSVIFCILVVLVIAFASAHAQQVRAQMLAHTVVDSMLTTEAMQDEVHLREWFDMCRLASLTRVAPLAQLLRGKFQFFASTGNCPTWLRLLSVVYYVLLKLVSLLVYFGFPGWALWRAYQYISTSSQLLWYLFVIGGSLAGLTLLHVSISDLWYAWKILCYLWHDPTEERKRGRPSGRST